MSQNEFKWVKRTFGIKPSIKEGGLKKVCFVNPVRPYRGVERYRRRCGEGESESFIDVLEGREGESEGNS